MIDLYTIFSDFPELRREIFSFFDNYAKLPINSMNVFIMKQLSRSFYYLPLYEKLVVSKQSKSFLHRFLKTNTLRKLHIRDNNSKLYTLPLELFTSLEKITIDSLSEREFYFFCKYFSKLPITNLKINYCTCNFPENILHFNRLKTLYITITSKENEEVIFDLLKINKGTLRKLKIGVYTGRNIDEGKMVQTIKDNLSLEFIKIRGDLFSYDMIKPITKTIRELFRYQPGCVNDLRYILSLRIHGVKNSDLSILFHTLEVVETVAIIGVSSNIESIRYSNDCKYKRIIHKPGPYEGDQYEAYDCTGCDVFVKSKNLCSLYLSQFTLYTFELRHPGSLLRITMSDVCISKPVYFPKVSEIHIDNLNIHPETFHFHHLKVPRLRTLNISSCLIATPFAFHAVKSLSIQNSIVDVDILTMLKRHKNLEYILFFHNSWSASYEKKRIEKYLRSKKIEYYHANEWSWMVSIHD